MALAIGWSSCGQEQPVDLSAYHVAPGFRLEAVAAEPLIQAPVAIDFDDRGRIWVVEMRGYMPNIEGTGEEAPVGRIVIVEDRNGDGRMDHSVPFLDSLVLPRALLLAYGGLLYAEPPNLWFVEIDGERPGRRTLVDSAYAVGGNVEHQANGLLLHLDNWIYNAKSNVRYRKMGDTWKKELTAFRGQWGITADDEGRLFYNNNSQQLQGDLALPNLFLNNPYLPPRQAVNVDMATSQRLYPLHATAVNRGYVEGTLDSAGRVLEFTSACGPLIYSGSNFPPEYEGFAFVCGPEGNLIKGNRVIADGARLRAEPRLWEGREFVSSTDEAFRPVNLYNGPDGALYIVDMHRGIIQHKTYMTAYLREQLLGRGLDEVNDMGRILRVVHAGRPLYRYEPLAEKSGEELLPLLNSENGWTRNRAQQEIIHRQDQELVPALQTLVLDRTQPRARLHALWTLEGLGQVTPLFLLRILRERDDPAPIVQAHALALLAQLDSKAFDSQIQDLLPLLLERRDPVLDLYIAATAGRLLAEAWPPIHAELAARYAADSLYAEAALSGLAGREEIFKQYLTAQPNLNAGQWLTKTEHLLTRIAEGRRNPDLTEAQPAGADGLSRGLTLYRTHCGACHGADGEGIESLAPPLLESEYVKEDIERLALVVLHGLQGPVTVRGRTYRFNGVMPGLAANPELTDRDISDIINYVRNAFATAPQNMRPERIDSLRRVVPPDGIYTEESLQ